MIQETPIKRDKRYVVETIHGYIAHGSLLRFTDDFAQAKKYRKLHKAKTIAGDFKPSTILDERGHLVAEMFKLSRHQKRIRNRMNNITN